MRRALVILGVAGLLTACGGEYRDDPKNFVRALNITKPADVEHVHSHYWQSAHFTDEHCYFLELTSTNGSNLLHALVGSYERNYTTREPLATNATIELVPDLVLKRPAWFAPKPGTAYDTFISTNTSPQFGILRDRQDGRVFVYGQCL